MSTVQAFLLTLCFEVVYTESEPFSGHHMRNKEGVKRGYITAVLR